MEENLTSDTVNCSQFSQPIFVAVTAVRAFSGTVSALSSIFVIFLIVVFKKYQLFAQRLILYLSITVLANGLVRATQGINYPYYPDNEHTDNFCILIGFIDQVTIWMVTMATLVIMFYTYMRTVHTKDLKLEILYFITIYLFPFTFCWIPFINLTYGRAGPWCWIRRVKDDCTDDKFGIALRYGILYVPTYLVLIVILTLLIIMYIIVRRKKRDLFSMYSPDKERQYKLLLKEVRPLIWYPIILILVQIPGIVNRIAEEVGDEHIFFLWFLHALVYPLQGGFICIAYALDPDTRKQLMNYKRSWRTVSVSFTKRQPKLTTYPMAQAHSDSIGSKAQLKSIN